MILELRNAYHGIGSCPEAFWLAGAFIMLMAFLLAAAPE